jgi:hypothetical protein
MLHFQHSSTEYAKRDYVNSYRALLQNKFHNFTEDWSSYWFYVKVDMSMNPGYEGPAHLLSSPIEALTAMSTTAYNHRAAGIRICENAFHLASTILGGRDVIEEFVAARIWPISYGWAPTEIVNFNVN